MVLTECVSTPAFNKSINKAKNAEMRERRRMMMVLKIEIEVTGDGALCDRSGRNRA